MKAVRVGFLLFLTLFVALAPVAPSYGCRCAVLCAPDSNDVEEIARGARQEFCACCAPEIPKRADGGEAAPRRSREICTCRKPAPQAQETSGDPVPAPAARFCLPTLEEFAAASRARHAVTHETASTAPVRIEIRLRV